MRSVTGASIALVVALSALRAFDPFAGDQALFLVGAKTLHAGGVLYRDFWDIKQPGIYFFYLAGGSCFGFTQIGIHVADAVWQIVFSLALVLGLRSALADRRWAAFAPLAVTGAYLTGSSAWHLVQVEELAGLPLFCTAWFAFAAFAKPEYRRIFAGLSGLAAAVAVFFKLLFAALACAIVLAVLVTCVRRAGRRAIAVFARDWMLGALLPALAFAAYAMHDGLAASIWKAWYVIPLAIASTMPHAPLERLSGGALRFLLYYRGIVLLGCIGLWLARDERSRPWRFVALVWIAGAIATILVQRQSWWQYHFALLVAPMGLLATFGVASLAHRVRSSGTRGLAWLALCGVAAYVSVPLPQAALAAAYAIAAQRPFASTTALENYRAGQSDEYAAASRDARYLARMHPSGSSLYVFGDPLLYVLADRTQSIAVNGWALQLYTPAIWNLIDAELTANAPAQIFVSANATWLLHERSPQSAALIAAQYSPGARTADGSWFERR